MKTNTILYATEARIYADVIEGMEEIQRKINTLDPNGIWNFTLRCELLMPGSDVPVAEVVYEDDTHYYLNGIG